MIHTVYVGYGANDVEYEVWGIGYRGHGLWFKDCNLGFRV